MRTGLIALQRDRGPLALSFILPIAFFSIFAVIFGGRRDTTPKVNILAVDEDHSEIATRAPARCGTTGVHRRDGGSRGESRRSRWRSSSRTGSAKTPSHYRSPIRLLKDSSDMIAPQAVTGLLQKVAMTSMPDVMAELGSKYMNQYAGGFTSEQRKRMDASLDQLRKQSAAASSGMLISVTATDVVGENKHNPMVSLNAAAIGVMFLPFTASGASGSLLDEPESDTLDRVLSSRVTMGTLLAGKMLYSGLLAGI